MIAEYVSTLLPSDWPLKVVVGDLPAANEEIVGLVEEDGLTSTEFFGMKEQASLLNPILSVVIRTKLYKQGQEMIDQTVDTLHRYHDDKIVSSLIVGAPLYMGRTKDKLSEFQAMFRICVNPSTNLELDTKKTKRAEPAATPVKTRPSRSKAQRK